MRIKKLVSRLVRKYQTRDPFEMIKGMNVILVHYPLEGVRGFYQYFQRNHIIYLDERLTEAEQRFVLAHELGHLFLHKKSNAIFMDSRTQFNTDKYEREADTDGTSGSGLRDLRSPRSDDRPAGPFDRLCGGAAEE